jgi:hypothetical protein
MRLALATATTEKAHALDTRKGILHKWRRTSMMNATQQWQEVWSTKFT